MATLIFLGVDGGASKTRGVLISSHGDILAEANGPGSALSAIPSPSSCAVLEALLSELCQRAGIGRSRIARAAFGMCGVDFEDEVPVQQARLATALSLPERAMTVVNDAIIALWGASRGSSSCIVQHGTGITAAYRSEPGNERLFDHLGGGRLFDLRNALIPAMARMLDGRLPQTPLLEHALRHFGVDRESFVERWYRGTLSKDRLHRCLDLIFSSWTAGDATATSLVSAAADDYLLAARTMALRLGEVPVIVSFGGGVIAQAPAEFWNLLLHRAALMLPRGAAICTPWHAPERGAALLAAFQSGIDWTLMFDQLGNARQHQASQP